VNLERFPGLWERIEIVANKRKLEFKSFESDKNQSSFVSDNQLLTLCCRVLPSPEPFHPIRYNINFVWSSFK
jgi:hypothetical protein